MARVFPFRAVHYRDLAHLQSLIAPPYDVISPAQQEALYDQSPHNIVRLELARPDEGGGTEGVYSKTAALLQQWLNQEVLVRDSHPSFYVYQQGYTLPDGTSHARIALFGEAGLEDFSTGMIRPHEETFAGPKQDRLHLLRASRANISPIFGLYHDVPEVTKILKETSSQAPIAGFTDTAGIRHLLWRMNSQDSCDGVSRGLADRTLLIADGHHRYETALAYRNERRQDEDSHPGVWYERVLFALVSMSDPGLVVLPTHRILRRVPSGRLDGWQQRLSAAVHPIESDPAGISRALSSTPGDCRFVLVLADGAYLLTLPDGESAPGESLDISRLHKELLPQIAGTGDPHELDIEYTQDMNLALAAVRDGRAPAAVLVNPTPVEQVDRIAASGARMPEKSTYFYPKLPTGLVLRVEEGGRGT